MPDPAAEHRLDARVDDPAGSSGEGSSLLLGWLATDGIPSVAVAESSETLGPTDWVPLILAGTGALTAFLRSVGNLASARAVKILVRTQDGHTVSITGPVSKDATTALVQALSGGQTATPSSQHYFT